MYSFLFDFLNGMEEIILGSAKVVLAVSELAGLVDRLLVLVRKFVFSPDLVVMIAACC